MSCTASLITFYKDPDTILDYLINWGPWLGADDISTSTWTIPAGITKVTDTNTTKTVTIWLSGGSIGERYTLENEIVTTGGRTTNRQIVVEIIER